VDSIVLIFTGLWRKNAPKDKGRFLHFLKSAFSQRRKKLANALKTVPGLPPEAEMEALSGIDLGRRPEQLNLEEWFSLYSVATGGDKD
jgi:16S rRNA A1518/A1519 N6-dimethyltransferase RsmA/KsgA/DIM1 with predicted DNA glycosylase/AP lyase activity